MRGLTKKQRDILSFIEDFDGVNGMPPTVYEIAEHFKIRPPTAFDHLKALSAKGFITRSRKARGIALATGKRMWIRQTAMPVPLPVIDTAGRLTRGEGGTKNPHAGSQFIYFDKSLIRDLGRDEAWTFVLKGDSMGDLGFRDGDVLVADRLLKPADGDVVLARLSGGEVVVRSFHAAADGRCELRPANSAFTSVFFKPGEMELLGVIVGLQRSLGRREVAGAAGVSR